MRSGLSASASFWPTMFDNIRAALSARAIDKKHRRRATPGAGFGERQNLPVLPPINHNDLTLLARVTISSRDDDAFLRTQWYPQYPTG
jgi:hypothetical protein